MAESFVTMVTEDSSWGIRPRCEALRRLWHSYQMASQSRELKLVETAANQWRGSARAEPTERACTGPGRSATCHALPDTCHVPRAAP